LKNRFRKDLDNAARVRSRRTFLDFISQVLENDQVKNSRNKRALKKSFKIIEEAKSVCKWNEVFKSSFF
jgi:precorrin-3B methylase